MRNRQREAIYSDRRHILEGDDLHDRVQKFLQDVITEVVEAHTSEGTSDDWDLDALWTELKTLYPVSITIDEVLSEAGNRITSSFIAQEVLSDAKIAYSKREEQLGAVAMRELERRVVLSVIDRRWRDHLYEMDYLKDGIGLRAMAQRDPLVEYQREGFALFQTMMGQIREETIGYLFNLEVEVTSNAATPAGAVAPTVAAKGLGGSPAPAQGFSYSAPSDAGGVEVRNQNGQIQRAATARAQQREAEQQQVPGRPAPAPAPAPAGRPGPQRTGQPRPAAAQAPRGAFGQSSGGGAPTPPPSNRAARRAAEKNKG